MAKYKLKPEARKYLFILVVGLILLLFLFSSYKKYKYKQSYEYKFTLLTYTLDEFNILNDKFSDKELDKLLTISYNKNIPLLSKEKYFMFKNVEKYLSYLKENKNTSLSKVISLVNVNRDKDYYKDVIKTSYTDKELTLVNKYYYLDSDYKPDDIVKTSGTYSYADNSLNKEAYEAFQNLNEAAKLEGYTILINSSYRDYKYQEDLYNSRKKLYGTKIADDFVARAGHSEHQTGYALDVSDYYDEDDEFGKTEAFKWMSENCYKFGYILRYPEDKEDITGYGYEPWHYRYVGVKVAKVIYDENITFDEYYAFYINK